MILTPEEALIIGSVMYDLGEPFCIKPFAPHPRNYTTRDSRHRMIAKMTIIKTIRWMDELEDEGETLWLWRGGRSAPHVQTSKRRVSQ